MGHLVMSEKERLRKAVFEKVKQGRITLGMAAKQAELSYRQAKRSIRNRSIAIQPRMAILQKRGHFYPVKDGEISKWF